MTNKCVVHAVEPRLAIPGGEIAVHYEFTEGSPADFECLFDGFSADITAASNSKLLARVPEGLMKEDVDLTVSNANVESDPISIKVGQRLCDNMHIVANPAVDPSDGSIVLTRSGTRGQELPATLFRHKDGNTTEMDAKVLNPTGVAFDSKGSLFVTNRADGEVLQVNADHEVLPLAADLGVATGLAFDAADNLFIGDRGGTIYRISGLGDAREWAEVEPSVSAFHMAFGPDEGLYVAAPGLCSHDVIHKIGKDGSASVFFKGLGRPQGLAFDDDGNLYVAACLKGRHGIVRILPDGSEAVLLVAGMSIVGLAFDAEGDMIVATADAVYRLRTNIFGTLV